MGTTKKKRLRVVLDTNILVSALLFKGELSKLVTLWKEEAFVPVISRDTFEELRVVLEYPKFALTQREIDIIIKEEILPYCEVAEITTSVRGICKDPHDDKFLSCALSASADFLVTGDKVLYSLKEHKTIRIIKASEFIKMFE